MISICPRGPAGPAALGLYPQAKHMSKAICFPHCGQGAIWIVRDIFAWAARPAAGRGARGRCDPCALKTGGAAVFCREDGAALACADRPEGRGWRSEEHTSELYAH